MTAPFAPPPPPGFLILIGVMICFAAGLPFARRDDWLGWVAFAVLIAADVFLWGMLLGAGSRAVWQRIRRDRDA